MAIHQTTNEYLIILFICAIIRQIFVLLIVSLSVAIKMNFENLDLEETFTLLEYFWDWIISWSKSSYRLSFFIGHEFREIPFDERSHRSSLFRFEIFIERMSLVTINIYFIKHVELYPIFSHECFDLFISTRLLAAELITWEC